MGAHREGGQYRILRQRTRLSPLSLLGGLVAPRLRLTRAGSNSVETAPFAAWLAMKKLYTVNTRHPATHRLLQRLWTRVKTGQ